MKQLFAGLILFSSLNINAQDKFSLTGKLAGLPEGSAVSLSDANVQNDTLAKGIVKEGVFELNGTMKEPNLVNLNFDGVKRKAVLFIGNDNIKMQGKIDSVMDVQVMGSRAHDDFELFKQKFNPLFEQLTALGKRMSASNITKGDSLSTAYKNHLDKIKGEVFDFISKNPASPVSPFVVVVTSEIDQDPGSLEKKYAVLDKKVQSGFYGNIIRQQIDDGKVGQIGSQAIEFSQTDTDGKEVALKDFRGKYVLVDFWASWCRPCRVENPNVVKAYNKFKDKNFTVLGISLDKDKQDWLDAIKEDMLTWTHLSDLKFWNNEVAAKYRIQSIPQNFLIDPQGKIVAKNLRGADLDKTLGRLLN